MNLELQHKTAVVTGSTAGIGLAIASLLGREGQTFEPVTGPGGCKNLAVLILPNESISA